MQSFDMMLQLTMNSSFWHSRQPNIVFDPPIALQQAFAVATPTHLPIADSTSAQAAPTAKPIVEATTPPSRTAPLQASAVDTLPQDPSTNVPSVASASPDLIDAPKTTSQDAASSPTSNIDPLISAISHIAASTKTNDRDTLAIATAQVAASRKFNNQGTLAIVSQSAVSSAALFDNPQVPASISSFQRSQDGTDVQSPDTVTGANDATIVLAASVGPTATTEVQSIGAAVWTMGPAPSQDQITASEAGIDLVSSTLSLTRLEDGQLAIDGVSQTVNGLITVKGAVLSVQSGAVVVHIGNSNPNEATTVQTSQPDVQTAIILANSDQAASASMDDSHVPVHDISVVSLGGRPAAINGITMSVVSDGIIADGIKYTPMTSEDIAANIMTLTMSNDKGLATATILPGGTQAVIAGTTIANGSPAITLNGVLISMASNALIVDGSTIQATASSIDSSLLTFTNGGVVFTTSSLPGGNVAILDGDHAESSSISERIVISSSSTSVAGTAAVTPPSQTATSSQTQETAAALRSGVGRLGGISLHLSRCLLVLLWY